MKVITVGVFDLLHAGHTNLFKKMRENGDYLIVIVHDDKSTYQNKNKFPVQSLDHRMRNIEQTGLVDDIQPVHSADPSEVIEKVIKFNSKDDLVYMRGNDWQDFPGRPVLDKYKVPVKFITYTSGVSSTELRDKL